MANTAHAALSFNPACLDFRLNQRSTLVLEDSQGNPVPASAVTWSASNTNVKVTAAGLVIGLRSGNSVVTGTYGGQSVKCNVTVREWDALIPFVVGAQWYWLSAYVPGQTGQHGETITSVSGSSASVAYTNQFPSGTDSGVLTYESTGSYFRWWCCQGSPYPYDDVRYPYPTVRGSRTNYYVCTNSDTLVTTALGTFRCYVFMYDYECSRLQNVPCAVDLVAPGVGLIVSFWDDPQTGQRHIDQSLSSYSIPGQMSGASCNDPQYVRDYIIAGNPNTDYFLPSICSSAGIATRIKTADITYVMRDASGALLKNQPVALEVHAKPNSGYHFHDDPSRDVGCMKNLTTGVGHSGGQVCTNDDVNVVLAGNTGADGLGFVVRHTWPEFAGTLQASYYSTGASGPYLNDTAPIFSFTIAERTDLAEMPESGTGYSWKPPTATHAQNRWGTPDFIQTLEACAEIFATVPGAPGMVFTEGSLPNGGRFDINGDWGGDHLTHRDGRTADLRTHNAGVSSCSNGSLLHCPTGATSYCPVFTGDQLQTLRGIFALHGITVLRHCVCPSPSGPPPHWHLTNASGLGTYSNANGCSAVAPAPLLASATPSFSLSVSADTSFDSNTGLWRYDYTVTNLPGSTERLDGFTIRSVPQDVTIEAPPHWAGAVQTQPGTHSVVWRVAEIGPPPPGWDGLDTYPGPYHLAAGSTVSGFRMYSAQPPAGSHYVGESYASIPEANEDEDAVPADPTHIEVTGDAIAPQPTTAGIAPRPPAAPADGIALVAPNPGRSSIRLVLALAADRNVELAVVDLAGRRVRTLASGPRAAGLSTITWDRADQAGRPVHPGVYFAVLRIDGRRAGTRSIVVLN